MNGEQKTYTADQELAVLLRAAARAGERLRVEADGETYEIEVKPVTDRHSIWDGYDAEAVREAWNGIRGILPEGDPDEIVREIKAQREQDSTSRRFT